MTTTDFHIVVSNRTDRDLLEASPSAGWRTVAETLGVPMDAPPTVELLATPSDPDQSQCDGRTVVNEVSE